MCKNAAVAVIDMYNAHLDLFDCGFAWGYINGMAPTGALLTSGGNGVGSQYWVGKSWRNT